MENHASFADLGEDNGNDHVHFELYAMPMTPLIRHIYAEKAIIDGHGLPSPNGHKGSHGALMRAISILVENADKVGR